MKRPDISQLPASGAHTLMSTWAAQFSRPALFVRVMFTDGISEEFEIAVPTTRDVYYKVDGKKYSVPVDTAKFDSYQFDLYGSSAKEIMSAFETWLQNAETKYSKIIRVRVDGLTNS